MTFFKPDKNAKDIYWSSMALFLVGMHSVLLGLIIYFFTDLFYEVFFTASIENFFFVRQSGIFLFLIGIFYLYPLFNLKNLYNLILLVIFSKTVAVIFLISNAGFAASPATIYLAAFFDGLMAIVLATAYYRLRKTISLANKRPRAEEVSIKETA
jgi:hypothetical protein